MVLTYNFSSILKLAFPMLASMMLEQLIGLTDIIFLGRYSEVAMGACALGSIFFSIFVMVGLGYIIALQAEMGKANGAKNTSFIGSIFIQGNYFLFIFSICCILGAVFLAPSFFSVLIDSKEILESAYWYFLYRILGLPFVFICATFRSFYIATLRTQILTYSSLVTVCINCFFNYFLIFGFGPIPDLGAPGAAIASTIAGFCTMVFFYFFTLAHRFHHLYNLFSFEKWNFLLQKKIFSQGRWLMLREVIVMGIWFFFFVWVEHMGERPLAISNIVRSVSNILWIFTDTFGVTCGSIAANLIGMKKREEIPRTMLKGMILSFCSIFSIFLIVFSFPEFCLQLFTSFSDLRSESVNTLRVMITCFVLGVPAMHYSAILGLIGASKESFYVAISCSFFYGVASFILTHTVNDIALVWLADIAYYSSQGITCAYFWRKLPWIRKHA